MSDRNGPAPNSYINLYQHTSERARGGGRGGHRGLETLVRPEVLPEEGRTRRMRGKQGDHKKNTVLREGVETHTAVQGKGLGGGGETGWVNKISSKNHQIIDEIQYH